jgi:hypothetical protein
MKKLIGYWMADLQDLHLPLPQELVGEMADSVRDAVCAYLSAGDEFVVYRGNSWCRFRCGEGDMGCRELTDGEWVWPEGLVHYVRVHGVVLPADFVASATAGRRADRSEWADDRQNASLDCWIEWSVQRQSPTIRDRLKAALADAQAAEPARIQSIVEGVLAREKEGSEECVFAGCSGRALVGRRICARHTLSDGDLRWRTAQLYGLPEQI